MTEGSAGTTGPNSEHKRQRGGVSNSRNDAIERCEWRCLLKAQIRKLVLLVSCRITSIGVFRGGFFIFSHIGHCRIGRSLSLCLLYIYLPRPNYSPLRQVLIGRPPDSDDARFPRRRRHETFPPASLHSISLPFVFAVDFAFEPATPGGLRRHRSIQAGTHATHRRVDSSSVYAQPLQGVFTSRDGKVKGRQLRGTFA